MANFSTGRYLTLISDADISTKDANGNFSKLYCIVSVAASTANTTGRKVVLATSATDANIIGVLNNAPAAGEPASICGRNAEGTFKVRAGANTAAISVGDQFTVDTDSGALKTTTTGHQIVGIALEAAVAGQIFEYLPMRAIHA